MNAVRMQDGQIAVPILSAKEHAEHKRLGHRIEFTVSFGSDNYQQPSAEKPGSGGWIEYGKFVGVGSNRAHRAVLPPDASIRNRAHRAVLPPDASIRKRGFWGWMKALFA